MLVTNEMIEANLKKHGNEYDPLLDPLYVNLPAWKKEKRWWINYGTILNHLGAHVTFLGKVVVFKKNKYKLGS